MKKAYLLLLCSLGLLAACTQASKENELAFQSFATNDPNATIQPYQFNYKDPDETEEDAKQTSASTCNFIIDRCKLREPGSNISVDDALSLLITEVNPSVSSNYAYKFLGYDTLDDGTCYIISYGKLMKDTFTETARYAISYNKTIYQGTIKNGKLKSYKEIYSLETGNTSYKNNITASIENGMLLIRDQDTNQQVSSFSLEKYGLSKATTEDIFLMDMNFDNYLDVAIYTQNKDNSFGYHAFLYQKNKQRFSYEISYSYLTSPEYCPSIQRINCSTIKEKELVYDTYTIVNNQPEICERVSYQYEKENKMWKMEHYIGENGELRQNDTQYYTSSQVSDFTGQFISDN